MSSPGPPETSPRPAAEGDVVGPDLEPGPQGTEEVKRAALVGVVALGIRTLWVRALGLIGTVVLARYLTPGEFGLIAIGTSIVGFAITFSDGGVGVGLIRGPVLPTREQLRALAGLQLLVGLVVVAIASGIALIGSTGAAVTAAMVAVMPVLAFRSPVVVLLERRMGYRRIASIDAIEAVVYTAWSITAVILGAGVWGVVTATLVRSIVGVSILVAKEPGHPVPPSFRLGPLKPVIAFGLRFQVVSIVGVVRDQALNVLMLALGGTAVVGVWAFGWRIMQVPYMLLGSLWRVGFPAMNRLMIAGTDMKGPVERATGSVSLLSAVLLVPLGACAPALVPIVFGHRWDALIPVLPWTCLALLASGAVSAVGTGYLGAAGRADVMVRAAVLHSIAWIAVSAALMPWLGAQAVGIGWFVGAVIDLLVLALPIQRGSGARLLGFQLPFTTASGVVLGGVYFWSESQEATVFVLVASAAGALLLQAVLVAVLWRARARAATTLITSALRRKSSTSES